MNNDRLKFRIFYNGDYYITPYCTIDMNGKVWLDASIIRGDGLGDPDTDIIDITDKCAVEICTGLQDKNGNLIYQNDQVEKDDCIGTVKFGTYSKDDCGGKDAILGFCIEWDNAPLWRKDFNYWVREGIEIIGNIHKSKGTTMTDKLHCPFCGAEMVGNEYGSMWCSSVECIGSHMVAPEKVWQALIDGKKAQDALKEIANYTYFIGETDMKWHVRHLMNIARKAITKQGE